MKDLSVNSVIEYNFEKPFLALNYINQFDLYDNCKYTKGCKWAPDGTCLLVGSSDNKFRLFNLPVAVSSCNFHDEKWLTNGWMKDTEPALVIAENEDIYDYCWYPQMNSSDPKTCCLATSCRDLPIHLWDAWTGELRASYLAYDHLDEMVAAYSMCMSYDGCYIFGGYNKCTRIFDINKPGKDNVTVKCDDHIPRVSSMAAHPQLPNIYAAASYDGVTGLFSTKYKKCFSVFKGHNKGITHVMFSHDGCQLFSGTRKDNEILCWDMRNPGAILAVFKREPTTNQRMYFDVTPNNQYLVSGTSKGDVISWDLKCDFSSLAKDEPSQVLPNHSFKAHLDCVNGISIHPYLSILATSSGQRHSTYQNDSDSDQDELLPKESNTKLWWTGIMC